MSFVQSRRTAALIAVIAVVMSITACGGGDDPAAPQGEGTVNLTITDGAGDPLIGAIAYAQSRPEIKDTSDAEGKVTLIVPAGRQTIIATLGAFEARYQVTVTADAVINDTAAVSPKKPLAYVAGSYDEIEVIVRDSLGYAITELQASDIATANLSAYSMLFFNCGMDSYTATEGSNVTKLKNWVNAGGILYVSDLAIDVVQALFPEHITYWDAGNAQTVTATVTDAALATFIGKTTVTIEYDLGAWATLDTISATPKVLLRGDYTKADATTATNMPLAIVIEHGAGKVVYTTFHNEAGVTADQIAVLRYFIHLH